MSNLSLIFNSIDALGSIATAVAVIIALQPFFKRLKVSGDFSLNNTGKFVIHIYNPRNRDIDIIGIHYYKGNPNRTNSFCFGGNEFDEKAATANVNTHNLLVSHNSSVDIPIDCKCIACKYDTIGEAFGKPHDKIYILIRDSLGHRYCIDTKANAEFFKKISG